MTRVRIYEWLIAGFVVLLLHGAGLAAWALLTTDRPESGVVLPGKATEETAAGKQATDPSETVTLSVRVIGAPVLGPGIAKPQATQENQAIAAISTSPDGSDKDTSQILPTITTEQSFEQDALGGASTGDDASSEGSGVSAAVVPEAPVKAVDGTTVGGTDTTSDAAPSVTETSTAAAAGERRKIRGPVPVPKARPDADTGTATEASPAPPAAPDESKVASVTPTTPAESQSGGSSSAEFSAAQSNYYRVLIAELKNALVYPDSARSEGLEGTVYLKILVQRSGRIKSYDIITSSGHPELDEAAVETLKKANPAPAFPDEIQESELNFGVPIRFP